MIKFEGAKVASLFFLIFVIIKYGTYNCHTIQSVHIWLHEFIFQCAQHHIHHTYIPNYLPNPHIRSPGIGAATAATAGVSVSVIAWRLLVHTDIHFKFNSISDE